MPPKILTIDSFPILNVPLELYNEVAETTGEYKGRLPSGWSVPRTNGRKKPERRNPPLDKRLIEAGNVPYLIVLRKKVDADPNKPPSRDATCALLLVGAATYKDTDFSSPKGIIFDRVIRSNIRVVKAGLPLDFQIRADEVANLARIPGIDVGQVMDRQLLTLRL